MPLAWTRRTRAREIASQRLRRAIESARPQRGGTRFAGLEADTASYAGAANMSRDEFHDRVGRALEYIVAGDIFQVQVSRRFALPLQAHPFDVYVALRAINPSPYMIYVATPECTLVGASPEMLVQVTGRSVALSPDRRHPAARTHAGETTRAWRRSCARAARRTPST